MKNFMDWFKKPLKLTETEAKILKACELILSREDRDIEINPYDMSYLINSKELSYYLHVNSAGIAFTNHDFFNRNPYSEQFIDLIKETIKTQTIIDRNHKLDTIAKNENALLDKMIEKLSE